jgi:hypothetical protein
MRLRPRGSLRSPTLRACRSAAGAVWLVLVAFVSLGVRTGAAENRVIMRGNYYREASTRVLQPTVDVQVDVPDERLSLGAAYMLDAISSASIASGAAQVTGGDAVFTEFRHETTGYAASRLGDTGLGAFFRYSTETDYVSRSLGASGSRDFLQRTVTLSLAYAYNFDRVFRIVNNIGARAPWCSGNVDVADCRDAGRGPGSNLLQVHDVRMGYTHALHRLVLAAFGLEIAHARGPQDNPYRGAQILGVSAETHPLRRTRAALSGQVHVAVPGLRRIGLAFEPHYRFTADSWGIETHAIDLRAHLRLPRHFRLRARYRFYVQSSAFFFRDDGTYTQPTDTCLPGEPENCATADPKMGAFLSHTPGVSLTYELDGLARRRGMGWIAGGSVEATYNHVFQTNRFGSARLGALQLVLPF